MKVCQTYLSRIRIGDVIMYRRGKNDFLGTIITTFEGNLGRDLDGDGKRDPGLCEGDYTHCGWVSEIPDPNAEVKEVRPGVYEIKDTKKSGKICHATWPVVKEEAINWSNPDMELWRIRKYARDYEEGDYSLIMRTLAWAKERIGRPYNILQFLTFGWFRSAFSWICSGFIYRAALAATESYYHKYKVVLSPDGKFDKLPTPNDLINSGKMFRIIGWLRAD